MARSARPSKGDADACTPLSVVLGMPGRPSASQLAYIIPRSEADGALAGSVGPRTAPRKSPHERFAGSNCTTKYVIDALGAVNLPRIDMKKALKTYSVGPSPASAAQ